MSLLSKKISELQERTARAVMGGGDKAIAKQIAIKHGGTIEIQSEVGKGTEIIFTFPEMEENYRM